METALKDRHRVGVEDFVLLEDFRSVDAFIDNLLKRFKENLIYTYIGQVLISVNPYKPLPIYTTDAVRRYRKDGFIGSSPHVFAVTDSAYRSLTEEHRGQCILISGESGSGKTEASKYVLQFVAAATGHQRQVEDVKDKLLQSNPVLEAFGNAKTNKNDNSSRFGKYMDIAFNFKGDPLGGNILNYLLEKSRVVHQNPGERNFHIFYQLLSGAENTLLDELYLSSTLQAYSYLNHTTVGAGSMASDVTQFQEVRKAMSTIGIHEAEQMDMFRIVASILHLGNVVFIEEEGRSQVMDVEPLNLMASLLGCSSEGLVKALTNSTIDANGDVVVSPLRKDRALYARDALAKAVYDRLFTWLVRRLNSSLQPTEKHSENAVMGILDIYGFEVFKKNSFEQFCINYCNEKLQQLFIRLTLKQEQEEYLKEGIEWENIEFYDNKIICDMIEEKHKGMIAMLDEECLRPGDPTDLSLLDKMNHNLSTHEHFISHIKSDIHIQKTMGRDEFRLMHYAGEVTYNVRGFLDKNTDLLFRDLREVMTQTTNSITKAVFTEEELNSKKRPETAITQFKNSLNMLMDILVTKEPSYIRCIKPNDFKRPAEFDSDLVKHQVQYLGLMENLRVRRAGFAYRRPYEDFLQRYKCMSRDTWPNFHGPAKEGVKKLVNSLGYGSNDYRMGKTKLFIRSPKTLFDTEDAYQAKKHDIATIIQKVWKGRQQRLKYEKLREVTITVQKYIRGLLARRARERRKQAVQTIRRFIQGYITRHGPTTDINKKFVEIVKVQWLERLSKQLPKSVMDKYWPPCPAVCQQASELLRSMVMLNLGLRYRMKLTAEKKKKMEDKVLAEFLFKGKKKSYPRSLAAWFQKDRLQQPQLLEDFQRNHLSGEKIMYSTSVTKYDRNGYKPRPRALIISDRSVFLLDSKTMKLKHQLSHSEITEVSVTSENDSLLLVRIPPQLKKHKGDLILTVPHIIETVTTFIDITKKPELLKIVPEGQLSHNIHKKKPGTIKVLSGTTGNLQEISKNKSGELIICG